MGEQMGKSSCSKNGEKCQINGPKIIEEVANKNEGVKAVEEMVEKVIKN